MGRTDRRRTTTLSPVVFCGFLFRNKKKFRIALTIQLTFIANFEFLILKASINFLMYYTQNWPLHRSKLNVARDRYILVAKIEKQLGGYKYFSLIGVTRRNHYLFIPIYIYIYTNLYQHIPKNSKSRQQKQQQQQQQNTEIVKVHRLR